MFTIALIGADGAGKTTIAHMLQDSFPIPIKYLYMGINLESSNVALPSSRFIQFLKRKFHKESGISSFYSVALKKNWQNKHTQDRRLRAAARLIYRVSEEWFRQFISWSYQARRYIVIYDRHFRFDFDSNDTDLKDPSEPLSNRLHRWLLAHFYPQPDLVLFLDAPAKVLLARKNEATLSYHEARREAFIRQGRQTPNFIRIDATQPTEKVFREVSNYIIRFYEKRTGKTTLTELDK
jgi:thymidylate kinase